MTDKILLPDEAGLPVLSLDDIALSAPPSSSPDQYALREKETLARKSDLQADILSEQVQDARLSREQRRDFAQKVFALICIWLFFVGGMLLGKSQRDEAGLSDQVMMTLMGATTVNVLGLFLVILKALFPSSSGPAAKDGPVKPRRSR